MPTTSIILEYGTVFLLNLPASCFSLVPIRELKEGTDKFPIQKCAIFCKFKKIKGLRGGVLLYTAQAMPPDLSRL
jgi:hypothetical protein